MFQLVMNQLVAGVAYGLAAAAPLWLVLGVSPRRALPWLALACAILAVPTLAAAQDVGALLDVLPPKYVGPAFAVWLFAYYIAGPLLKRARDPRVRSLGEYLTQDTHRPPPPGKTGPSSSAGVVRPFVVLALASLAAPAFAQDSTPATATVEEAAPPADPGPAFGGCVKTEGRFGEVCAGPTASLAVASFRGGELLTGFRLAAGYGAAAWSDRWYATGLSVQLVRSVSSEDEPASLAVMATFARYLRVGVGRGGMLLFALGVGGG